MNSASLARLEWRRFLNAPAAGASDVGRGMAEAAGWGLVVTLGHYGCEGWTYDRRTGLTCRCGAVLDQSEAVAS